MTWRAALYRVTLERWYLDELSTMVIGRLAAALRGLDALDRKLGAQLEGRTVEVEPVESEGKVPHGVS
jgi:hypothetical protein